MSDPQYDTEFWFNATLYTAYDWHGDFNTVEDAREAFDAWLNNIRAEAWEEAAEEVAEWCVTIRYEPHNNGQSDPPRNPYCEEAE